MQRGASAFLLENMDPMVQVVLISYPHDGFYLEDFFLEYLAVNNCITIEIPDTLQNIDQI